MAFGRFILIALFCTGLTFLVATIATGGQSSVLTISIIIGVIAALIATGVFSSK